MLQVGSFGADSQQAFYSPMISSTLPKDDGIELISGRLHAAHRDIALRWLERLNALLAVEPNQIFPTGALLDHVPQLIAAVADYIKAPATEEISANTAVMSKASEFGALRYEQRASVHQLLREYDILADLLGEFVQEQVARDPDQVRGASALGALRRMMQAVRVLQQQTVDTFVTKYTETIERQTSELRGFGRLVSHEIRQPLGVLQVLAKMWPAGDDAHQQRLAATLGRNVTRLGEVADKLERIARLSRALVNSPAEQHVELFPLVSDVARQLADMADAREVEIHVSRDLPGLVVDAGRAELVFINLLANAIKYADPAKPKRFIAIEPAPEAAGIAVQVRDNGIGIPPARLDAIFQQFVRVHADRDEELQAQGLGLGLAIVRESMAACGGTVTVASRDGEGTTFTLSWPPPASASPAADA